MRFPLAARNPFTRSWTSAAVAAEGGAVGRGRGLTEVAGEVVRERVREHEVAVGEALHEGARPEAIRAVIGEIGFAGHEQAVDVAHQVVIDPESSHRVVRRRVDAHRRLVGILTGDALVHLEQVPVLLLDDASTPSRPIEAAKSR